jgi:hypothetical protein
MAKRKKKVPHIVDTKTPQEMMAWSDAGNMVKLLRDIFTYMPATAREALKNRGFLQFKIKGYDIMISDRKKFERPANGYGRAVW